MKMSANFAYFNNKTKVQTHSIDDMERERDPWAHNKK